MVDTTCLCSVLQSKGEPHFLPLPWIFCKWTDQSYSWWPEMRPALFRRGWMVLSFSGAWAPGYLSPCFFPVFATSVRIAEQHIKCYTRCKTRGRLLSPFKQPFSVAGLALLVTGRVPQEPACSALGISIYAPHEYLTRWIE